MKNEPMPEAKWELITVEVARALLAKTTPNRRLRQRRVNELAHAMRTGAWIAGAGDPLRVSVSEELQDGQHRCSAIIASGCPQRMLVLRNVPDEAMQVFDTGSARTLADFLHMQGEVNAENLAGALVFLNGFLTVGEMGRKWHVDRLTSASAHDLLAAHPGLRASYSPARGVADVIGGGKARWMAVHYVLACIDEADCTEFFRRLHEGTNVPSGCVTGLLRNRLLRDRTAVQKMSPHEYCALVFKAWNLYRKGVSTQLLSWRAGGANPEPYPTPI